MQKATVSQPYTVDVSKGEMRGEVSAQWYKRPADQRYLSLDALYESTKRRSEQSRAEIVDTKSIRVEATFEDSEKLEFSFADRKYKSVTVAPTHWVFSQASQLVGAPAGYLRKMPASIAAINLQYGFAHHPRELVKTYIREDGGHEFRAMTGPDYGRIHDHEIVNAVRSITGNGLDQTRWKVPGVLNWKTGQYDPFAPVTSESTTLFASDRDVFLFLVDDTNPIKIGTLPNGDDDLVFRGFYVYNSEVGHKRFGLGSMVLRGVCQNRNLWGVEGFQQIDIRHSKYAPARAAAALRPVLRNYAESSSDGIVRYVENARKAIVAKTDNDREEWLQKQGFSKPQTREIIATVLREEQIKPSSVWDFVNGITAVARGEQHQDERVDLERKAAALMAKVNK